MKQQKVRGPSTTRKRGSIDAAVVKEEQLRLTLTMTKDDMLRLQKLADANIRSMAAQALFYLRGAMERETNSEGKIAA